MLCSQAIRLGLGHSEAGGSTRVGAVVGDCALEHIELGGAATLEGVEALLFKVAVVARRDTLRGVARRQLQVRIALGV